MSEQIVIDQSMVVEGDSLTVSLIQNPLIDDVLVTEMQVQAASIWQNNDSIVSDRRVSRDIRDWLIRLGVER